MKEENVKILISLSKTCHNSGMLPIFLGLFVVFMDIIDREINHAMIGIFIFIIGYSLIKISQKINKILEEERKAG